MTSVKHVFILSILILPMFILAPAMVPGMNDTQANLMQVDGSVPAQFAQETLRVAVYAEPNTTLPSYATGGVYTSYYQNVVNFLVSAGYAVTALTTQDILDHKLMVAGYDAFVLPNQLPRESIVNYIKDYWLGGGGILSFDGSIGYCFYAGFIDSSLEGDFELTPPAVPGYWALMDDVLKVRVSERHPVTKAYALGAEFSMPSGNFTKVNGINLPSIVGDRMHSLVTWNESAMIPLVVAFDNPNRGGRIVQVPTTGSPIPSWLSPIIIDSIDWLAPRPKARVAFDFSKTPYYGVDDWDENVSFVPRYNIWRDFLVNHSFTVDKLYPPVGGALAVSDVAPFDVLIISLPADNYSAFEMTSVIRPFVVNGGGLFYLTDYHSLNPEGHENMNELIAPWGFDISGEYTDMGIFTTTDFDEHPTLENIGGTYMAGGEWVNITGGAYSIIRQGPNIAVAGCEVGYGRVIVSGDINFLDYNNIDNDDNRIFAVNTINWLSSGTADVLVYTDGGSLIGPDFNYYRSSIANALNGLGISFFMTNDVNYFNLSLATGSWSLVIYDANAMSQLNYDRLVQHLEGGGKLIMRDFRFRFTGVPLWNYIGFEGNVTTITAGPPTVHLWTPAHPVFNLPVDYGAANISSSSDHFNTDFTHVVLFANATALAGITLTPEENMSAIVLGAGGQAICNMFAISEYEGDTDDSTYADNFELFTNEIAFLYFDRPTLDHPADVAYMETETGNEITWSPTAPAGAWEYILSVNGTPLAATHWSGGPVTIDVDGLNASTTTYELTVFDRLGYSVSDLVILNVTEYVAPWLFGIDPLLLVAIVGGIAAVIVVVVIVMKKKSK